MPVPGGGEDDLPERPEGMQGGEFPQPPEGMEPPGDGGAPSEMMNQGFGNRERTGENNGINKSSLISSVLCIISLILAILFIKRFRRRKI